MDESLHKICHYQQNVPQHYYLLDTLVIHIKNVIGQGHDKRPVKSAGSCVDLDQ